jgi:hypothetical protein
MLNKEINITWMFRSHSWWNRGDEIEETDELAREVTVEMKNFCLKFVKWFSDFFLSNILIYSWLVYIIGLFIHWAFYSLASSRLFTIQTRIFGAHCGTAVNMISRPHPNCIKNCILEAYYGRDRRVTKTK